MNTILSEVFGVAVVLTLVGLVLTLAAMLRKRGVNPEWTRKLAHVLTAIAVLPMPLLIHSVWTLPAMALFVSAVLWLLRKTGNLAFLDDVKRSHWSEYCFVAAIGVVSFFSRGDLLLYAAPVLVLGVSDALAAVVGVRFGAHTYTLAGTTRSWEGSAACALSAFAVCLALLALTGTFDASAIVRAALVGAMVAAVEAASPRGSDNFFIPVTALAVLAMTATVDLSPALTLALRGLALVLPLVVGGLVHQVVRRTRSFERLNRSLDDLFFAGRVVFGANKTIRGFVVVPVATALAYALFTSMPLWSGALIGLAYVLAELPNSYLKRRLGIAPGSQARKARAVFFALDHLDSAAGCAIVFLALGQAVAVVISGLLLGPLVHVAVNFVAHRLRLRTQAW